MIYCFVRVCFVFTVRELWPTAMSPNAVFDEGFNQAKKSAEVISTFGEPLKAYGIDSGGHREGRRNFIQSREYKVNLKLHRGYKW
jgi:mitochondrial import inner membrane translocase subunit TIM21